MSDNTPLLTVVILLEEIKEVDNWYMLGAYLSVPVRELNKIESTYTHEGVERCKLQMLQYWLDTTMIASWRDIARALEQLNMLTLAARLKSKYLWTSPTSAPGSSVQPSPPRPGDIDHSVNPSTDPSTDSSSHPSTHPSGSTDPSTDPSNAPSTAALAIVADVEVVGGLQDLECDFSNIFTDARKDLTDCDVTEMRFFLADLFENDEFNECRTIDEVLRKLRRGHVDTFNVYYLECLISRFHRSDMLMKSIEEYIKKKEKFLKTTTVQEFQQAVVSRAEAVCPKGMAEGTIKVPNIGESNNRTMKDVEKLAKRAFKGLHKDLVRINVTPGSIIITWYVSECLCEELVKLAQENIVVLREEGVKEVSIEGKKSVILYTQDGHEVNIPEITEQEYAAAKVYKEFYNQLVDVLSDGDTHLSIVSYLHSRSVISEKVRAAQMTSTAQERGSSLLTVLCLEEKPHKLRELITVMMEVDKLKSLAGEMTAQLSKYEHDESADTTDLLDRTTQYQRSEKHEAVISDLKYKLKKAQEELCAVNSLLSMKQRHISSLLSQEHRKETGLKEMRRRVADLEEFVLSQFPSFLVQATGKGKELTTAGRETSFELSLSSQTALSLPFPIKHLSCQLTDPHHQCIDCSITSTQPGVCTVKYTPTLDGPHQLRITISNTEIAGSPFTVHVLPSPEMMGVVQHTITGINRPWGTVVTKSGEVVVSEYYDHCISVYSREGKKIRSFGSSTGQLQQLTGVAITSDNHILVADEKNGQILMFTMEGTFVKSVGQQGEEPLQFYHPSGIAVHPSGRVFVAESMNHRMQVLNPDLTYSHMFGSEGSALGQMSFPHGVAINSSGVVYVTDYGNHRVQLFSADGEFVSSFGSEGSQHGQLYNPSGIFVDSTNTVYVTDFNHRVSVYTSSGQLIHSFGTQGIGEGELNYPKGVAVDDTTGALYVCDFLNNRVVVY